MKPAGINEGTTGNGLHALAKPPRASWIKRYVYWSFVRGSSLKRSFVRRISRGGALAMIGAACCVAIGLDTNMIVAYQLLSLLMCVVVVAFIGRWWPVGLLEGFRILPLHGSVGVPLKYSVRIRNPGRVARAGLTLLEQPSDPRPSETVFLNSREPGEEKRNPYDRYFGFYRWQWLCLRGVVAEGGEAPLPAIPPGGTVEIPMQSTPRRRGVWKLESLDVAWPDPFGLVRRLTSIPERDSVVILPKRYALPQIAMPGRERFQQGGVALAGSVGESEEFVSLRDYRRGDPLRRIHWRSVGRTGRLIVKECQNEFFVRHGLLLDTFAGGVEEDIFEEAVSIAASFVCHVRTQESLLDLMFVGPRAYVLTSGRGVGHAQGILEVLSSVEPCVEHLPEDLEHLAARHAASMSGCVAVFVAWDEARWKIVERLQAARVPVMVLLVVPSGFTGAPELGPMRRDPASFHVIRVGKVQEDLRKLA